MVTVAVEIVADGTAIEEVGALVVVCVSVWSCDRAEKGGDRDGWMGKEGRRGGASDDRRSGVDGGHYRTSYSYMQN